MRPHLLGIREHPYEDQRLVGAHIRTVPLDLVTAYEGRMAVHRVRFIGHEHLPPDAPINLQYEAGWLTWDDVVPSVGYNVYISTDGQLFYKLNTALVVDSEYELSGFEVGTYYAYVTSFYAARESAPSNTVFFTSIPTPQNVQVEIIYETEESDVVGEGIAEGSVAVHLLAPPVTGEGINEGSVDVVKSYVAKVTGEGSNEGSVNTNVS